METQAAILDKFSAFKGEVSRVVRGQDAIMIRLAIGPITRGYILLEGMPGVAKTLTVRILAAGLSLKNTRVQFASDLMPGDLTGFLIFNSQASALTPREGPIFMNLSLADEINRTPSRTQSVLLETMGEHQVSVDGVSRELPNPFTAIVIQNPMEYEGTYPLSEAQLNRFLLKFEVPLLSRGTGLGVLNPHLRGLDSRALADSGPRPVANTEGITVVRQAVKSVSAGPEVLGYIVDLVHVARTLPQVELGVSPHGVTALLATSRIQARLCGRNFVTPDDVKSLVLSTFRHRLRLCVEAEMEGVTAQSLLDTVLSTTSVPR